MEKIEDLSEAPECETLCQYPNPVCYGTVECRVWSHLAQLDFLPSAGTSLLDYKRGLPVARPRGGRELREVKTTQVETRREEKRL
jgi:hypothetical protein